MEDDSTTSQMEEEDEKIPPRLPDKFHQYTTKVCYMLKMMTLIFVS